MRPLPRRPSPRPQRLPPPGRPAATKRYRWVDPPEPPGDPELVTV